MNAVIPTLGLEYRRNAFDLDDMGQKRLISLREVAGYAATWNMDQVSDRIVKGAFAESIRLRHDEPMATTGRSGIRVLYQHDEPIGVLKEIKEDDFGLWIRAYISKTRQGEDTLVLLDDGAIDRMSIGFNVQDSTPEDGIRVIKKMDVWEVSFVTFPANLRARVLAVKGRDAPESVKWVSIPVSLRLETKSMSEEAEALEAKSKEGEMSVADETKAGRSLSKSNMEKLGAARGRMREAVKEIEEILSAAGFDMEDDKDGSAPPPGGGDPVAMKNPANPQASGHSKAGDPSGEKAKMDPNGACPECGADMKEGVCKACGYEMDMGKKACVHCNGNASVEVKKETLQEPEAPAVETSSTILEALKSLTLGLDRIGKEG